MTFAAQLRAALDAADMSPAALCKATGISRGAVSEYLIGYRRPTKTNADKINAALGTCLGDNEDRARVLARELGMCVATLRRAVVCGKWSTVGVAVPSASGKRTRVWIHTPLSRALATKMGRLGAEATA